MIRKVWLFELGEMFIERAKNNFSFILSMSQSAEEFATKMKALARHARDEHERDEGRCDFTCLKCAVVESEDKEDLQCEGKDYHKLFAALSLPLTGI